MKTQKTWPVFLLSFFICLPLWWSFNVAFGQITIRDPQLLLAQASQGRLQAQIDQVGPIIHRPKPDLDIMAKSALAVRIENGNAGVIFQKNSLEKMPIASLSKLLTALVVLENYKLTDQTEISRMAVAQEEDTGQLKAGERLTVEALLHSALIESSNDAAYALADIIGQEAFIDLCNLTAQKIGLKDTHFVNVNGLIIDGKTGQEAENYSTASDLAVLSQYILENQPMIWDILAKQKYEVLTADGAGHHTAFTTNELLAKTPDMLAGKTGWTETAGGCLLAIMKAEQPNSFYININIILGSDDRFGEMQKLINWQSRLNDN